jgi:hypothetical protein
MLATSSAHAADLNVAVAARVIGFRQPPPGGSVIAAIVFDPGDVGSVAEAASIERSIGNGMAVGKGTLRAKRVPVGQLGGLAGASVAFVTGGLRDKQAEIAAAAQKGSILTVTSDSACVLAGRCAVAVSNTPKVQITVSRAACKAARIQFGSAFLMLVKEI